MIECLALVVACLTACLIIQAIQLRRLGCVVTTMLVRQYCSWQSHLRLSQDVDVLTNAHNTYIYWVSGHITTLTQSIQSDFMEGEQWKQGHDPEAEAES